MTDAEIRAVLARVTYRDWTFSFGRMHLTGNLAIDATCPVRDSHNPERLSRGGGGVEALTENEAAIVRAAYEAVVQFSTHEIREFFMVDGERPFDPHAELGMQP